MCTLTASPGGLGGLADAQNPATQKVLVPALKSFKASLLLLCLLKGEK